MWVAFAMQKLLTFFQQKISAYSRICVLLDVNFNESLTNDIVSFEQLGPEHLQKCILRYLYLASVVIWLWLSARHTPGENSAPSGIQTFGH